MLYYYTEPLDRFQSLVIWDKCPVLLTSIISLIDFCDTMSLSSDVEHSILNWGRWNLRCCFTGMYAGRVYDDRKITEDTGCGINEF